MFTVDPLIISNNLLYLSGKEGIPVTPMKLQKLLYFLYRDYLKKTKVSLFSERFEAWKYGPVIASVYNEFNHYEDNPIKEFYKDNNGKAYKLSESRNLDFGEILHSVWDKYKYYNGIELSKLTQKEDSAWYKAWCRNAQYLDDKDIIDESVE